MDYKNAGVDIEAGYESVELMKKFVKGTMRPEVLGGLGVAILSTNQGVITDKEARKLQIGGEVLAFVW